MKVVWRLIRTQLGPYKGALFTRFLIAAAIAATPYGFSFLGKWLVDEALQVTGPPKVVGRNEERGAGSEERPASTEAAARPKIEWKAKTQEEKLRLLGIFFVVSMTIHVLITAFSGLSEYLNSRTANELVYKLRTAVHDKLERFDLAVFSREQVGQLMTRVLDDAGAIPGNLTALVINFFTQIAMLILGLTLLFRLDGTMALFALASLPFYAVSCIIFLPRIRDNTEDIRVRAAELNGFLVERLSNIATVKNYAQEERELTNFGQQLDHNIGLARRQHRLNLAFGTLTTIITAFGTLAVLAYGFLNLKAGKMQLGEVMAFYQVTAQLFVPIAALVGLTTTVQALEVLGVRVYSVLDTPATLVDAPDAADPEKLHGEIVFDHVSLRYEEGGPFAVQDVNLTIPAGKTVCIVGPTGCGKSTLLALLNRLYDPSEGVIKLDGIELRRIRIRRLRHEVGNVLHDCQVFSGTIAENLCYGEPKATPQEMEAAARAVELHDFIQGQPKGYQTRLGRGGITLDTEHLVKLALARALVTDPAVMTVDDTYSGIEEEVEERIRLAVRAALVSKTILIATSRLSICEDADLVVVMQQGEVAQVGTHTELLAVPGLYRRMYMRQMGMAQLDAALEQTSDGAEQGPSQS